MIARIRAGHDQFTDQPDEFRQQDASRDLEDKFHLGMIRRHVAIDQTLIPDPKETNRNQLLH
jgi:hypothetical protein